VNHLIFLVWVMALSMAIHAQEKVVDWRFEGDLKDSTSRGNDASVQVGEPTYIEGRFGQALAKTNDLVLACLNADGLPLRGSEPWSLNLWLKLLAPLPGWSQIGGFRDTSNAWGSLRVIDNQDGFNFYGHMSVLSSGNTYPADGAWHMYTCTWDGTKIRLYVDGTIRRARCPGTMAFSGLADLTIAHVFIGLAATPWAGEIDEFSIWKGQLAGNAIKELFTGTISP